MRFQVIASGSSGNMTYIESDKTHILLDAGVNLKEATKRSGLEFNNIDGILITHEHSDHISSLATIAKKMNCNVYMNENSYNKLKERYPNKYDDLKVVFIKENVTYNIGDIRFMPLLLSHYSVNCYGYVFVTKEDSFAYITDTGFIPTPYFEIFKKIDSIIIESNHDIEMLQESDRDWFLKQRILSVHGHMSNITCGEVVNKILKENKLKKVVLAHLSRECNEEHLAIDSLMEAIEGDYIPEIIVAHQFEATALLEVK